MQAVKLGIILLISPMINRFISARLLFDLNSYYVVISDRSRIYFVDLGLIRGKYVKLSHIINAYSVVAESLCNVIV